MFRTGVWVVILLAIFSAAAPTPRSPSLPVSSASASSSVTTTPGSSVPSSSTPASSEPASSSPASSAPVSSTPASSAPISSSPVSSVSAPSSSSASSSSVPSPSPTTGPAEISAYLSLHNSYRAEYGAAPLTWSTDLQASAESWAQGCQFRHSDGALGPVGENLAAGTGSFSPLAAVNLFISDASQYDPLNPTFSHFTQVVWKSTTQLGCAVASCDSIFDPSFGQATYHVCLYNPVGNVVGEEL
ncbi:CAP domain-containing protein [Sparassis latifolia]